MWVGLFFKLRLSIHLACFSLVFGFRVILLLWVFLGKLLDVVPSTLDFH